MTVRRAFRGRPKGGTGSRWDGFWRWPRRECGANTRSGLGPCEQRRPSPKATQPGGRDALGPPGGVGRSVKARCGDSPSRPPYQSVQENRARPRPTFRATSSTVLLLLLALPAALRAGPDPLSTETQAVFQRSAPAVVKIEAEDDQGPLSGTGFFVDPNGTIFTNYSVGGESRDIVISYGGARYLATRVAADARSGLAILKLGPPNVAGDPHGNATLLKLGPASTPSPDDSSADPHATVGQKTPFLPLGKASDLAVASMVMTIGYPLNLPVTPNVGCVGGFSISDGNRYFAVTHIRANVPVQRGEAGAPLLNMNGEVVGILESSMDGGSGCFALPIEAAEKVQSDIVSSGDVRPGWLGIRFNQPDTPGPLAVQGCIEDSPAEKAGIQAGDMIQKVGDRQISSIEDVLDASFYLTVGEQVPLTVLRGDKTIQINVIPESNPTAPQSGTAWNFIFKLGP